MFILNKDRIGILLLLLYLIQCLLPYKWDYLIYLQHIESYKRWSGLILFLLILFQWSLTISRVVYNYSSEAKQKLIYWHQLLGAISPLVFYMHSSNPGYALLLFLTIIFFINILLGVLYDNICNFKERKYFNIWLGCHILCSAFVFFVSIIHIWIVFYYS